jgi:hypothetical protein
MNSPLDHFKLFLKTLASKHDPSKPNCIQLEEILINEAISFSKHNIKQTMEIFTDMIEIIKSNEDNIGKIISDYKEKLKIETNSDNYDKRKSLIFSMSALIKDIQKAKIDMANIIIPNVKIP